MARILVADDEAMIRDTISMVCRSDGHEVIESIDTMTTIMSCVTHKPDLLLLDLSMPGGGGREVLRQLRASGQPVCPVIIVSGYVGDLTLHDRQALRVQNIIEKPFQLETLRIAIRAVLDPGV